MLYEGIFYVIFRWFFFVWVNVIFNRLGSFEEDIIGVIKFFIYR